MYHSYYKCNKNESIFLRYICQAIFNIVEIREGNIEGKTNFFLSSLEKHTSIEGKDNNFVS